LGGGWPGGLCACWVVGALLVVAWWWLCNMTFHMQGCLMWLVGDCGSLWLRVGAMWLGGALWLVSSVVVTWGVL
jgi:hypothetical protein